MSKLMSLISARVKAIIFDLDDTLYDCSGTLVLKRKKLAAKIISKAIKCSEAEALKLQLELEDHLGQKQTLHVKSPVYITFRKSSAKKSRMLLIPWM